MEPSMRRDEVLAIIRAHTNDLHHMDIASVSIFGSVARDEAGTNSDIDVLIEFIPDRPAGLFEMARVQRYLEKILGRPIDLTTPGGLRPRYRDNILKDLIRAA